jgi:topoisomerase-4 subunit A
MIDLENDQEIIGVSVFEAGQKFLIASSIGKGFIVPADDLVAQTKNGRNVMNVPDKHHANVFRLLPEDATHIACIGTSRKLLIFPMDQMVEMKKGQGVTLQKFKDGKLTDAIAFNIANGLSWPQGDNRTRTEGDVTPWLGNRAGQGKLPPQGFPKNNRFD